MNKSILTTAAALTALLLSGCICETPDGACPVPQGGNVLQLKLSVAADTRANPTPGHDGDGREHGTLNESTVRDLNIFFVNDAAGLASDNAKDLKIKASIYTGSITQDLLAKPDRIDIPDGIRHSAQQHIPCRCRIHRPRNAAAGDARPAQHTLPNLRAQMVPPRVPAGCDRIDSRSN